ncbi:MAG: dephospho-CoA kinase [Micropepsaceae bacterium]
MLIIGLTGSIGMGKSETAKMFARHNVPVCDSDSVVHRLYDVGGAAVKAVSEVFPTSLVDGRIDRDRLSKLVIGKPEEIRKLELLVHPLVAQAQAQFLQDHAAQGASMVLLDIPLLLESTGPKRVDVVVVVSAPAELQRKRVLARPGMSAEKFESILAKQLPDELKRAQADYVIDTSQGLVHAEAQVISVIEKLRDRKGLIWK